MTTTPASERCSRDANAWIVRTGPRTFRLDCDHLHVQGTDLRLVVYTAAPGSPDAEALALLGVVGLQRF